MNNQQKVCPILTGNREVVEYCYYSNCGIFNIDKWECGFVSLKEVLVEINNKASYRHIRGNDKNENM